MLTNKEDGKFTISEIEVWEVVNVENLVFEEEAKSFKVYENFLFNDLI
jgi:hypothetical protein